MRDAVSCHSGIGASCQQAPTSCSLIKGSLNLGIHLFNASEGRGSLCGAQGIWIQHGTLALIGMRSEASKLEQRSQSSKFS